LRAGIGRPLQPDNTANRRPQKQTEIIMSKTKTSPNGTGGAATPADAPTFRNIPEVDAKIDNHIKEDPKYWAYIQGLPRDRLERMVVLNEVRELERQQRMRNGMMERINSNPALKEAYETLVKNVPEDQREDVINQIDRQTRRAVAKSRSQQQTRGQAVTV
jgi:hypothetical protein